jgi:hypothetical protein
VVSDARKVLEAMGAPVWGGSIAGRAAFGHALVTGQAVTEFQPNEAADQEITKLWRDVKRLTERLTP